MEAKLRKKIPDLKRALRGHVMEHHRFMFEKLLDHLALLEEQLVSCRARIDEELRPFVDDELLLRLLASDDEAKYQGEVDRAILWDIETALPLMTFEGEAEAGVPTISTSP